MNEEQFLSCIAKFADKRYVKQNLISVLINKLSQEEILKRCYIVLDNPQLYTPKQVYGSAILVKSL